METETRWNRGAEMTDKQRRKKLCEELRFHKMICDEAANEIERLSKELEESEAALRNTLLNYKIGDVHIGCDEELDAMKDHDNQKLLKAEMRCHALEEEIEHLNRRLEEFESM